MTRPMEERFAETAWFEIITAAGHSSLGFEERCAMLHRRRNESLETSSRLDRMLLDEIDRRGRGLQEAGASIDKLKELLDKLTTPPWHSGVFLRPVETEGGPRAMVHYGNGRHVVNLAGALTLDSLQAGEEVFLNNDLSAITAKSPFGLPQVGEMGSFSRLTEDGRLIVECRDEELVVSAAASLDPSQLKPGDLIRWDKATWMAYERVERASGRRYFLDEVPDVRPETVGGQRTSLQTLLGALKAKLVAPDLAKLYDLDGRETILMVGPPGCGKTLMARVAAAEIARTSGKKCRFAVVKPGEWEDPYVGVTQRNIRECFEALREASEEGYAVLFLDEIETIGRVRGSAGALHADKFLGALLTEIDGFAGKEGIAIITATNRKDLVDPALLQRLSGIEITVDRPDIRGAREIFQIHLKETLPYHPNGEVAPETRKEMINQAVSQLYAPNAQNELCTLKFRDGKTRTVTARELASGRVIEQICRDTRRTAFQRHVDGGEPGLRLEDMIEAVSSTIQRLSTTLTPQNAHAYLFDLPQDTDVVAVEPVVRPAGRAHRYLNQ
ncbi:MAG: AAA family ATPase [Thermoguttaceae bacterium]